MNANSIEAVPSTLPVDESAPSAQTNWLNEVGEYVARFMVVGFGIFLGWIVASIIGVMTGWIPFSFC